MKEVLHLAFSRLGGVEYLVKIGNDDPKTFCALLARIVPNQVALDVKIAIDLGAEMLAAEKNRAILYEPNENTIDITPINEPLDKAKPLIIKNNV